jgi:hypothetical protein
VNPYQAVYTGDMAEDSQTRSPHHPLVLLGLAGAFVLCLFYVLHLHSILWSPLVNFGGQTVAASEVHKLGENLFYYQNRPFTGNAVRKLKGATGPSEMEVVFKDGILHHKLFFEPKSGRQVIFIQYENEKLVSVRLWASDGKLAGEFSDLATIRKVVKDLGYSRLYQPEALL